MNKFLTLQIKAQALSMMLVLVMALPLNVFGQDRPVSGQVVDIGGEALPGVTVLVKGTTNGTITDVDGNYKLSVGPNDVISFSFVGFATKEQEVGNRSIINVALDPEVSELDEIVVIGYGSVKKSDLTGSVSSVDPNKISMGSMPSVDQMMTGRVSGVQINQNSAEPGGSVNIRIRGANSITGGNDPLFVIDGMPIDNTPPISGTGSGVTDNRNPRNPLSLINPNDIASIEVLKDASATAIYGSRGANGVILVTTKQGSGSGTQVSYDYAGSIQKMARPINVLSATEFAQTINGISEAGGNAPIYDMGSIVDSDPWLDEITQTGYVQNHNLSVSGGNGKNKFYSSINYFDQEGIVMSSGMNRITARLNATFNASDKFTYGVNLTNSYTKNDNVPFGTGFNAGAGIMNTALEIDPTLPKYNADGSPYQDFGVDLDNPLIIGNIFSEDETTRILGNAFAEYSIIEGLTAKLNMGVDRLNSRKDTYVQSTTKAGLVNGSGIGSILTGEKLSKLIEGTLSYKTEKGGHSINAVAGYSYQDFSNRGFSGNIDGFSSDVLLTNNFGLGSTERDNLNSYNNSNTLMSYLARVNYVLNGKYLLTASIRADGSSRFGENNKFGYFPSMAFSWRMSDEAFMQSVEIVSNLKLRASWGKTGNQSIGNYASLATLGSGGLAIIGGALQQGLSATRIPNPDLRWETTAQTNFGFDMELGNGRVNVVADYFLKNTSDLLLDLPLPKSSGFGSILSNVGSVKNQGVELMVETYNIDKGSFTWSTAVTFTSIRNEVTSIGERDRIFQGNLPFTQDITVVQVGAPLNSYYGHVVDGIWQEGDDIANSAQPGAQPGYPKFRDISGPEGVPDGAITDEDKTVLGSPFPDFSLGLRNSLKYKRLSLDIFFAGDFGQELLNQNLLNSLYPIEIRRNRLAEPLLNRWTPENPSNQWPSGVNPNAYGGSTVNSLSIEDASFFRLRNVRLGYDLNTSKIGFIQSANIYLQGSNLLLFTNYLGFDPETNSLDNAANSARADYNSYPNAKTYTVGCSIRF